MRTYPPQNSNGITRKLKASACSASCLSLAVEGREPEHSIWPVQAWSNKGKKEPDYQQETQEAGIDGHTEPAGKRVARSGDEPPW
jgi:hypothetical protein